MQAALLPDRGVVKVAGDDARRFSTGSFTVDIDRVTPERAAFAALLTPQGKIIVDCIVAEAPSADGGGFFLDCPRALAKTLADKLTFYKLRAKVSVADLSDALGVLAVWDGGGDTEYGLCYRDPRLPALGTRCLIPPQVANEAAADLGATLVDAAAYEAHRIALGVPRGGLDFIYGDAFPHETDMDQLAGVDFAKGCYVGQEVVSRIEHRGTARKRVVPIAYRRDRARSRHAGDGGREGARNARLDRRRPRARHAAARPRRGCARRRHAARRRPPHDPAGASGLGAVCVAGRSEGTG